MNIDFELATPADAEDLVKVQIAAFHDDARLYPGVEIGGPPGYDSVEETLATIARGEFYKVALNGEVIGGMTVIDQGAGISISASSPSIPPTTTKASALRRWDSSSGRFRPPSGHWTRRYTPPAISISTRGLAL